tara:strand:- start:147 stop:1553 length:1407 start_codon:yes stop_codon:yes gene_type:complete
VATEFRIIYEGRQEWSIMAGIWDISSEGLFLAMDFKWDDSDGGSDSIVDQGEPRLHWNKVILNILEANDFDAIPLVSEPKGRPSRIARRRYHDGDLEDLFVLGIEEVDLFESTDSIIDVVFSVLSNEHHIALVGREGKIEAIVTLHTLASPGSKAPFLKSFLDQKVADVAELTGEELHADLGRRAFEGIRNLASLVDSDRTKVSDRDFTQGAIDVLTLLQPLKEHSNTAFDLGSIAPKGSRRVVVGDIVASDFMKPFMVGVRQDESQKVTEDARDGLSQANDFSNILCLSPEGNPEGMFRLFEGSWELDEVGLNHPGQGIEPVLRQLSKMEGRVDHPVIVLGKRDGGFGIIAREEASSDVPAFWMLKRLAVVENRCRDWLISQGVEEVRFRHWDEEDMVPIQKASFGQILHHDAVFRKALRGRGNLNSLLSFRNELVHKVVAETSLVDLSGIGRTLSSIERLNRIIPS